MSRRSLAILALAIAALAATGGFVARNLEISSGLSPFLSELTERDLAAISAWQMDSRATRSMILRIRAPERGVALAAARDWETALAQHSEVEALRSGPDPDFAESIYELYFPRRFLFVSDAEALARDLGAAAQKLRSELSGPRSQLIREIAPADPLLTFPHLLDRFQKHARGELEIVGGQFADQTSSFLILTTRHSAFESNYQAPFEDFLQASFKELNEQHGGRLTLERSAVHRFAVASERRGVSEMQQISTVSLVGIAFLFLLFFRSLWLLAAALVPLLTGILVATSLSLLVYGELHLMTVIFGATLIGVCIDYPIHYICHHTLLPSPDGPRASLTEVWPGISMGALTTVAGFAGLAWSDFPGIRELGVFAAIGILGALLATRLVLPSLLPWEPHASTLVRRAAGGLSQVLGLLGRKRRALLSGLLCTVALAAAGAVFAGWQDDVYALNLPTNSDWAQEDQRVRGFLSKMDLGRFVVVMAEDDGKALQGNDAVFERLSQARADGVLRGFRSLHTFLPSEPFQLRSFSALSTSEGLRERTLAALEHAGFYPEAFSEFTEAMAGPPPAPLRFADLAASPLESLVAPFRIDVDKRVAILTFLEGVSDATALEARLSDIEGVHYFDQQRFIGDLYGRYRGRVTLLVLAGLVAVAALLYLRFRKLRDTIAIIVPALTAAGATLALLTAFGVPINLLHLLGLLLVLSIGVDYSIFLATSGESREGRAATLLSLCIACASTCLAFGLLSFSAFPALQALGVTTGTGAFLSLLLAPSALALIRPEENR